MELQKRKRWKIVYYRKQRNNQLCLHGYLAAVGGYLTIKGGLYMRKYIMFA